MENLYMKFDNVSYEQLRAHVEDSFPILPPLAWAGSGKPSLMFIGATDLVVNTKPLATEYVFRDKDTGGALLYVEIKANRLDLSSMFAAWTSDTELQARTLVGHVCYETGTTVPAKLANRPPVRMRLSREVKEKRYLLPDVFPAAVVEQAKRNAGWAKRETYRCNQWLAEQYFVNGRTRLKDLVPEWMRIREEEDLLTHAPADPVANMRAFIGEERKRRNA